MNTEQKTNLQTRVFKGVMLSGFVGLILLVGNSKERNPRGENYPDSNQPVGVEVRDYGKLRLYDLDGDRQVDAITNGEDSQYLLSVADGYMDKAKRIGYEVAYTKPMSSGVREAATKAFEGTQGLGFEMAKSKYESAKSTTRRN